MNPVWQRAIRTCADPQRAGHYLEQLAPTAAGPFLRRASPETARLLAALWSGSQALGELQVAHPEWIAECLEPDSLKHSRQDQGLRREVSAWLDPLLKARDDTAAFSRLREFKQQQLLRIAARDLGRLGNVEQITGELSAIADICLQAAFRLCHRQIADRLGLPYHLDTRGQWMPTGFCVLGLGKLGGQELNFSSDVDLLFVYADEGFVFKQAPRRGESGGRGMPNHQFFRRLIETFTAEVMRLTAEGFLFRVDLRLRPEGDVGPLARSLASYENFYAQSGQTWERMMLIKARGVAGDAGLAAEFIEMIQPFRYPRSLGERTVAEVAATKLRLENEVVKTGELDRNVKLGRGGIREIEFVVQTLQLLNAGRQPFLQNPRTLPTLDQLARYQLLPEPDAGALREAYCFLRDVEHRLQMENNLQTHTIPTERKARERLAALMGCVSLGDFEKTLKQHTGEVRRIYDALLRTQAPVRTSGLPATFPGNEARWKEILSQHSFTAAEHSLRVIETLVSGSGFSHTSSRTTTLALELIERLLSFCPRTESGGTTVLPRNALSDPDRVVARLDSFVSAYGSRAMLYETWAGNPTLFELIVLLFDRSEFLAETAIRTPDLVDELELSGRLRRRKSAEEILTDLRHGLDDQDQKLWLRQYHEAELMRIGLRDILGLADSEQNLTELSALADAVVQYALEVVLRRSRIRGSPIAVIGLGKLGGAELNYGSDLDLLFVTESKPGDLAKLQPIAVGVMDLLSDQTERGLVFATDARLRPDGEKGLLVNTLSAHEEYYRQRAQLWEIQALTRARAVAGNAQLGGAFHQLASALTDFRPENVAAGFPIPPSTPTSAVRRQKVPLSGLKAYQPGWKSDIDRMRARIQNERTPAGREELALKTGAGGLIDAEFIAQALCLENGWSEPNTLRVLQAAQNCPGFPIATAVSLIENYRKLHRIEAILRRWSYAGETALPDEPAPLYRVAIRCGHPDATSFMNAVSSCRRAIREGYLSCFGPDSKTHG